MSTKFIKSVAVLVISASALFADQFSGKQGDFWTGGSFNLISVWENDGLAHSEYAANVSPTLRFFPIDRLCVGPKLSWTGTFGYAPEENIFGAGIDLGYGNGTSVFGYVITSPHFVFADAYYGAPGNYSNTSIHSKAFFLPFTGGIIIPVGKNIGIQLEGGYSVGFSMKSGQNETANAISIGFGVCGLGQKVAVSVLDAINLSGSAF